MKLIFSPHPNIIHPFWQGNDVGTQYRSGIYFYTPEQEKAALESKDRHQKLLNRTIVTEILPAKKFYRAEDYHQQYLEKGGRFGFKQSAVKGCNKSSVLYTISDPVFINLPSAEARRKFYLDNY